MSKSSIFFCCILAFIIGVAARSFLDVGQEYACGIILLALMFAGVNYENKKILVLCFSALFLSFGIWKTDTQIILRTDEGQAEKTIEQSARVVSDPVTKNGSDQMVLEFSDPSLRALATVGQYSNISYGDTVKASCQLQVPQNKDASFDYRMYLAKENVGYICNKATAAKISSAGKWDVLVALNNIEKYFSGKLNAQISEPEGALGVGLIFGGSGGLSKNLQNSFARTGTTHIIAVSGYNVTIVAEYFLLLGLALGLWRKQALWMAIIGIILFVAMVGMPASAVRAGVMSAVVLWALKNGRLASSTNAILLAAAIMLFLNPLLLRWDIGFQLSFLATIGVVAASNLWQKSRFSKWQCGGLTEIIVLTLGAQIFVWPILAYNFQTFSVISLLANMLVLPIIPFSMLLVFLVAVTGFLTPYASFFFAWIAYVPLRYEVWIIQTLGNISWASLAVEKIPGYFIFIYYLALAAIFFKLNKFKKLNHEK